MGNGRRTGLLVATLALMAALVVPTNAGASTPDPTPLRDVGVSWGCAPLRYELNPTGAGPRQVRAVHRAVRRLQATAGHPIVFAGYTDDRRATGTRSADAPILVEFAWPDDAPTAAGFAEPFIVGNRYVGGSVYLHPRLGRARPRHVGAIALHELAHIAGLDHSDDPTSVLYPGAGALWFSTADRAALAHTLPRCPAHRPVWHKPPA